MLRPKNPVMLITRKGWIVWAGLVLLLGAPSIGATPPGRGPLKPQLPLIRVHVDNPKPGPVEAVLDGRQPALVTTFATWCKPCNKEVPILNKLARETAGRGLRIVAISLDEKPPFTVSHWMKERKVIYPVYYADIPVRQGRSILRDVSMMPTTTLLSRRGNILRRWLGVVPENALRAAIQPLLRPKKVE